MPIDTVAHTPGPWSVDDGHVVADRFKAKQFVGKDDHGNDRYAELGLVALVYSPPEDGHRNKFEANRRLIAAAPDLLKELKHLVRLLEPALNNGVSQVPGLATLNAAWAAIAKAEGR